MKVLAETPTRDSLTQYLIFSLVVGGRVVLSESKKSTFVPKQGLRLGMKFSSHASNWRDVLLYCTVGRSVDAQLMPRHSVGVYAVHHVLDVRMRPRQGSAGWVARNEALGGLTATAPAILITALHGRLRGQQIIWQNLHTSLYVR